MFLPNEEQEEEEGLLKNMIMSAFAIVLGVWIPNVLTGLLFPNTYSRLGDLIRVNNLYLNKYYLDL